MPLAAIALWLALSMALLGLAATNGVKRWRWVAAGAIGIVLAILLWLAWQTSPAAFPRWRGEFVYDELAHLLLPPLWVGVGGAMLVCLFLPRTRFELAAAGLSATTATAGILSADPLLTVALLQAGALLVLAGLVVHGDHPAGHPLLTIATGLKYVSITVVSAACLVMALLLSNFYALNLDRLELPRIIAGLFVIGFALAVGAMPFYFHVPDVFDAAPALTTVSFVGPLQCLGFVYLVRTAGNGPWLLADQHVAGVLVFGALAGALLASALTFGQRSVNRLLAFNAIREIGWLAFGIASVSRAGWRGALILLAVRCVSEPLLIVAAGLLQTRGGGNSVVNLSGAAKLLPAVTFGWCIGILATLGLPPLAGFWGFQELVRGSLPAGWPAALVLLASAALALWRFGQVTASAFGRAPAGVLEAEHSAPGWIVGCAGLGLLIAGIVPRLFQGPVDQVLASFPFLK